MRKCVEKNLYTQKKLGQALQDRYWQILRGVDGSMVPLSEPQAQAKLQADKFARMVTAAVLQAEPINLVGLNISETAQHWADRAKQVLHNYEPLKGEYTCALVEDLEVPQAWVDAWLLRYTTQQLTARLSDVHWSKRWLRTQKKRVIEHLHIMAGFTGRGCNGVYCSQSAVRTRRDQRARNEEALKAAVLMGDAGQQMSLYDVSLTGLGHKPNRRAEVMTRIGGLEAVAAKQGRACMMVTLTCPSRMHPNPSGGGLNQNYDGTTPMQASGYLNTVWARVRAALKRAGLQIYGMRAAEPHKDGCPHWHLAIWYDSAAVPQGRACKGMTAATAIEHLFRRHGLADSPDERGAEKVRVHVSHVQRSAAGYVAKYVAKLTDGHSMTLDDCEGYDSVADTVERADAWASHWAVRAFQFFGTPSVALWRTVRRLKPQAVEHAAPVMRELWDVAVKQSDYGRFTELLGGAIVGTEQLIVLDTERVVKQSRYDGEKEYKQVLGVCLAVASYKHSYEVPRNVWSVVWGAIKEGETVKGVVLGVPCPRINNCTDFSASERTASGELVAKKKIRENWTGEYPPW